MFITFMTIALIPGHCSDTVHNDITLLQLRKPLLLTLLKRFPFFLSFFFFCSITLQMNNYLLILTYVHICKKKKVEEHKYLT